MHLERVLKYEASVWKTPFVTINSSPWGSPQCRSHDPSLRRFDTIPQCE